MYLLSNMGDGFCVDPQLHLIFQYSYWPWIIAHRVGIMRSGQIEVGDLCSRVRSICVWAIRPSLVQMVNLNRQ